MIYNHGLFQYSRLLTFFIVLGSLVIVFVMGPEFASASEMTLTVTIPEQVVVTVNNGVINTVYSNLGHAPEGKEISWSNGKTRIIPDNTLVNQFTSLSQTIDWQKAGVIFKNSTIFSKIVSFLI